MMVMSFLAEIFFVFFFYFYNVFTVQYLKGSCYKLRLLLVFNTSFCLTGITVLTLFKLAVSSDAICPSNVLFTTVGQT